MQRSILLAGVLAFAATAGLQAQNFTEWNDPSVFQLNRESAHSLELPQTVTDYQK